MQWAWTTLNAAQLISVIHPDNAPSLRVAERLGLRRLREQTVDDELADMFGIEHPSKATS